MRDLDSNSESAGVACVVTLPLLSKKGHVYLMPLGSLGKRHLDRLIHHVADGEDDGPLLVRPRSHHMTTVLPAENRRVHPVDAAQMPPEEVARPDLLNPQLRRGDMLLMQGFTWHFADANKPPSTGRSGMYMYVLHQRFSLDPAAFLSRS